MHAAVVRSRVVPGANPNSRYLLPLTEVFWWFFFFKVALRKHLVISSSLDTAAVFVSRFTVCYSLLILLFDIELA